MMRARTGALLLIGGLAACSSPKEEPLRRERGLGPTEAPTSAPPAPTPPPTQAPPPSSLTSPFAKPGPNPGALAAPQDASAEDAAKPPAKDAGPERDLGRELAAIVGQPARCLDLPAIVSGGGSLTLSVRAQVMPSGRITRAEVTAPGQAPTAVRCIEDIVKAGSLRGPVPDAPREVSTSATIQASAAPAR